MAKHKPPRAVPHINQRDRIWAEVRRRAAAGETINRCEVARATGQRLDTTRSFLVALERGGVLAGPASAYTLVRDIGEDAPIIRTDGTISTVPNGQERMWLAMRGFTKPWAVAEIAMCAGATLAAAKSYIHNLCRAGYLEMIGATPRNNRPEYLLRKTRNTGPKPPAIQRGRQVYDRNEGRLIGRTEARHDEP